MQILLTESKAIIDDCKLMADTLADTSETEKECIRLREEMEMLSMRMERLIEENAAKAMSQTEYREKFEAYEKQFTEANTRLTALEEQVKIRYAEAEEIRRFTKSIMLGKNNGFTFSEEIWNATVEKVTVFNDDRLVFLFRNGREITEILN